MKATQVARDFERRVELIGSLFHDSQAKNQEAVVQNKSQEEIKRLRNWQADAKFQFAFAVKNY